MGFLQYLLGNKFRRDKYGHSRGKGHHGGGKRGHHSGDDNAYYDQEQSVNNQPQRTNYNKYCSSCGSGLQTDSRFCRQCGTAIT